MQDTYDRWKAATVLGDSVRQLQLEIFRREFLMARERAQRAIMRDEPEVECPDTPQELRAQGVRDEQIAWIWNWTIDGPNQFTGLVPDVARVRRELRNPGSEVTEAARAAWKEKQLEQMGFRLPADEAQPASA